MANGNNDYNNLHQFNDIFVKYSETNGAELKHALQQLDQKIQKQETKEGRQARKEREEQGRQEQEELEKLEQKPEQQALDDIKRQVGKIFLSRYRKDIFPTLKKASYNAKSNDMKNAAEYLKSEKSTEQEKLTFKY